MVKPTRYLMQVHQAKLNCGRGKQGRHIQIITS